MVNIDDKTVSVNCPICWKKEGILNLMTRNDSNELFFCSKCGSHLSAESVPIMWKEIENSK